MLNSSKAFLPIFQSSYFEILIKFIVEILLNMRNWRFSSNCRVILKIQKTKEFLIKNKIQDFIFPYDNFKRIVLNIFNTQMPT